MQFAFCFVMKTNPTTRGLKPETRRLIILDIIVAIACVMQLFKGVSYLMLVPVIVAQITLLGYGFWLLECKWSKEIGDVK
jgi:Flp pilus assembly protein TadB